MARRSGSTAEAPEATDENDTSTDSTTETTPAPADKPAEVEVDLTDFNTAVSAAVAERDDSTGEVPEASIGPVVKAYRALDGIKAKNKAKAVLTDGIKDGMNQMNIQLARAYMNLQDSLATAGSTRESTPKAPADPTEAFVERVAALSLAYSLVASNPGEGVDASWEDRANELVEANSEAAASYLDWFRADEDSRGDEPEVLPVVKSAVKLSQGKSARVAKSGGGSTFTGERRNIAAHIEEAFADKASGHFMSIAEIRSFKSTEYGTDAPSAGAISARLFPSSGKSTLESVTPGTDANGKKGATKN